MSVTFMISSNNWTTWITELLFLQLTLAWQTTNVCKPQANTLTTSYDIVTFINTVTI